MKPASIFNSTAAGEMRRSPCWFLKIIGEGVFLFGSRLGDPLRLRDSLPCCDSKSKESGGIPDDISPVL
jgi:hypothetical protein